MTEKKSVIFSKVTDCHVVGVSNPLLESGVLSNIHLRGTALADAAYNQALTTVLVRMMEDHENIAKLTPEGLEELIALEIQRLPPLHGREGAKLHPPADFVLDALKKAKAYPFVKESEEALSRAGQIEEHVASLLAEIAKTVPRRL